MLVVVALLQNGCTPLYLASQKGHIKVVHALIAEGASVNKPDNVRTIAVA